MVAWFSALGLGAGISFFIGGPLLFADGDGTERALTMGVIVVTFGVIALVLGLVRPGAWRWSAIYLAGPTVPVAALFGREMPLLAIVLVVAAFAASLFAAWGGALLRARRA